MEEHHRHLEGQSKLPLGFRVGTEGLSFVPVEVPKDVTMNVTAIVLDEVLFYCTVLILLSACLFAFAVIDVDNFSDLAFLFFLLVLCTWYSVLRSFFFLFHACSCYLFVLLLCFLIRCMIAVVLFFSLSDPQVFVYFFEHGSEKSGEKIVKVIVI